MVRIFIEAIRRMQKEEPVMFAAVVAAVLSLYDFLL